MLEGALVSGALSAGADVYAVGVLPTPGIAYLTRRLEAHGGVVLSASHNPFEDNGIKIFSSEGAKFPDAWEEEIEGRLSGPDDRALAHRRGRSAASSSTRPRRPTTSPTRGPRARPTCAASGWCSTAPTARPIGWRPAVFRRLGAEVRVLNASPDGRTSTGGVGAHPPGDAAEGGAPHAGPGRASPSTATATG